jgi:hypothetical protein
MCYFALAVPKEKRISRCAYCGKTRLVTDDHVPPKGLFPKPRPLDLATVPICSLCNAGTSKDDEYFRNTLALHFRAAEHSTAKRVLPAVWHSLQRPEARGFRKAFLGALHEVTVTSPMGLYVGKAYKFDIDYPRLERVAARVARGLFFHHTGRSVPPSCRLGSYCLAGRSLRPESKASLGTIGRGLQASPAHDVGEGAFRYKYAFVVSAEQHPNSSAWLFSVYGAVEFLILIVDSPAEPPSE